MRLYYFPDACSLAPHIALRETKQAFSLEKVDYASRVLRDGSDYRAINPRGSVPALVLDDGEMLTEVSVILQYIAAQSPDCLILPPDRDLQRFRCLEWLNYIATELHKSVSPLFRSTTPASFMQSGKDHLIARLEFVEESLSGQEYISAGRYSVADMYLFAVCRWLPTLRIDTGRWPAIERFRTRMEERPSVRAALAAEGLTQSGTA